ncbi:ParA family protein [Frigidibacter oleivorans]|uniref:ParA family protein n=1 Tax=Frigidibacter oleivorans TaxID=2487129 RepID=UPI000F8C6487|nr:ParA family protein [Frigidibacter oleivorans]
MKILIHNQKGGVGKTTVAANLGAALLRGGHAATLLLADLDPQMHLAASLAPEAAQAPAGRRFAVAGEPGLSLVAGTDLGDAGDPFGADAWVVADSAPGWSGGIADLAARADLVICPLEPDFLGLSGLGRLLERLTPAGIGQDRLRILLCRHNPRLALHREVQGLLAERFGSRLLPVAIRSSVKLAEAAGRGRTIFGHAPASAGAGDFRALAAMLAAMPAGHAAPGGRRAA